MLGFMLTSWFLSMWMCNTATTCMLLPILESVLRHIEPSGNGNNSAGMTDLRSRKISEFEEPHNKCCGDGAKSIKFDKPEASTPLPGLTIMQEKDDQEPVIVVDVVQPDPAGVAESSWAEVTESSPSLLPRGYADMSADEFRKLSVGLTLTICFAANIGGVATINGAIPNMIMKGAADSLWQKNIGETSPVHFTSWAAFGIPIAVINLIFLWFWMNSFYLGVRNTIGCFSKEVRSIEDDAAVETYLRREREQLGPVSVDQILVTISLVALVVLWILREPGFMDGWGSYFPKSFMGDATPAVLIGLLLFVIPANLTGSNGKGGTVPTLMDWDTMQRRFPWSVVLLMGGGFTLAKACAASGLSKWVGNHLDVFDDLPRWFMLLVILIMVALLTEVTSNPAACSLLMPIVAPLAMKMGLNPLCLMFPVCFATSFAFMLPAASPPNAIVFCYGRLRTIDMIMAGAVLNVVCVATVVLGTETWGMALFDLDTPPWNASASMSAAPGMGM